REFEMLLAEKQNTDPSAKEIWDYERSYLSELVRRSKYDFDSQSVRPYFPFTQVKQGILDAAAELFHVSFQQEPNVPAWDPSVETWIVIDNGKPIGRFYLDMHPRPGKYSHAEMVPVLDWHPRQTTARGHPRLQLPRAHRHRRRPYGLRRRPNVLPRIRPPHAPHPRRPATLG